MRFRDLRRNCIRFVHPMPRRYLRSVGRIRGLLVVRPRDVSSECWQRRVHKLRFRKVCDRRWVERADIVHELRGGSIPAFDRDDRVRELPRGDISVGDGLERQRLRELCGGDDSSEPRRIELLELPARPIPTFNRADFVFGVWCRRLLRRRCLGRLAVPSRYLRRRRGVGLF